MVTTLQAAGLYLETSASGEFIGPKTFLGLMAGRGIYPFSPAWDIAVLWGARQYLGVEEKAEDPGAQGLSRAGFRFHPALPSGCTWHTLGFTVPAVYREGTVSC